MVDFSPSIQHAKRHSKIAKLSKPTTPLRIEGLLSHEGQETDGFASSARCMRQPRERLSTIRSFLTTEMDNDEEDFSFEDGRRTKFEFNKMQTMDICTALIAFVGTSLTVIVVSHLMLNTVET